MFKRIAQHIARKRLARRTRIKGSASRAFNRAGRNHPMGWTAQSLWRAKFNYKETPAKKAGAKRRAKRERAAKKPWWSPI